MQFLTEVRQKAAEFVSNNATTLLTAGGVVGTVATAVLAGRGGFKAGQILLEEKGRIYSEQFQHESQDNPVAFENIELAKTDVVKLVGIHFLPPVLTGTATIAAIIMSNRISAQKAAALAAAYGLAERNLSEYKDKISEKLTGPKKQQIEDEIAQERVNRTPGHETIILGDGNVLCFDSCTGRYFQSTVEQLRAAMNATIGEILQAEYVRTSFFYEEIGLKPTVWTDETGWNRDHLPELKITSGKTLTEDNKPYLSVEFSVLPKIDYIPKHY